MSNIINKIRNLKKEQKITIGVISILLIITLFLWGSGVNIFKIRGSILNVNTTNNILCKRATTLHTETCEGTSDYGADCNSNGRYAVGETITYGQLGTSGTLATGDAFDCDVNGDGVFSSTTERFYYLGEKVKYGKEKDDSVALLVYYHFVNAGQPGIKIVDYDSSNTNWNGPVTAMQELPTTSQWSNVSLVEPIRQLTTTANNSQTYNTMINSYTNLLPRFNYGNKAARLMTEQELYTACYDSSGTGSGGFLTYKCEFLMENTRYSLYGNNDINKWKSTPSKIWLETPEKSSNISDGNDGWLYSAKTIYVGGQYINTHTVQDSHGNGYHAGVKPVIEIPKSRIQYGYTTSTITAYEKYNNTTLGTQNITCRTGETVKITPQTYSGYINPGVKKVKCGETNTITINYRQSTGNNPKCIRATELHTEVCDQSWSNYNSYCRAAGYNNGDSVPYGTIGEGNELKVGDAYDCDVNGDGTYDETNERFYYVGGKHISGAYDKGTFDNSTALLIYSNNIINGYPYQDSTYYDGTGVSSNGPVTATLNLPSTSQWSNVSLTTSTRQLYSYTGETEVYDRTVSSNVTLPQFSYSGKAARLLDYAEIYNSCYKEINYNYFIKILDKCSFLFEDTNYANKSNAVYSIWLETPAESGYAFYMNSNMQVSIQESNNYRAAGLKPVIEVSLADIDSGYGVINVTDKQSSNTLGTSTKICALGKSITVNANSYNGYVIASNSKTITCAQSQDMTFEYTKCGSNEEANSQGTECVCKDGYHKVNGVCEKIPTCQAHEELNSEQTECVCASGYSKINGVCTYNCGTNEVANSTNDGCVCKSGYHKVNDVCEEIPTCQAHEELNSEQTECVCASGYSKVNDVCTINCGTNQVPNSTNDGCVCKNGYHDENGVCIINCGTNEEPNAENNVCVCKNGYHKINGVCEKIPTCQVHEELNQDQTQCVCASGYSKVNEVCTYNCGNNEQVNSTNDGCDCVSGYHKVNNVCTLIPTCQTHEELNQDQTECVCASGYSKVNGVCTINCSENEEPNSTNDGCVCKEGYEVVNNVCTKIETLDISELEVKNETYPVIEAKTTYESLKETVGKTLVVKRGETVLEPTAKLATGDTFEYNNETYTIVIDGDMSKDGEVTNSDLVYAYDVWKGRVQAQNEIFLAGDSNGDGRISNSDLTKMYDMWKNR